jgi:hypothetical protein
LRIYIMSMDWDFSTSGMALCWFADYVQSICDLLNDDSIMIMVKQRWDLSIWIIKSAAFSTSYRSMNKYVRNWEYLKQLLFPNIYGWSETTKSNGFFAKRV